MYGSWSRCTRRLWVRVFVVDCSWCDERLASPVVPGYAIRYRCRVCVCFFVHSLASYHPSLSLVPIQIQQVAKLPLLASDLEPLELSDPCRRHPRREPACLHGAKSSPPVLFPRFGLGSSLSFGP